MSTEIVKDIGDIYSRIFNHRPFLSGEINFLLEKFETERNDREVESLFTTLQTLTELKANTIPRCAQSCQASFTPLKEALEAIFTSSQEITAVERDPTLDVVLEKNRSTRKKAWQDFVDDMTHKCSRIDLTFEEKEEELVEFYSDLERKLQIHK